MYKQFRLLLNGGWLVDTWCVAGAMVLLSMRLSRSQDKEQQEGSDTDMTICVRTSSTTLVPVNPATVVTSRLHSSCLFTLAPQCPGLGYKGGQVDI